MQEYRTPLRVDIHDVDENGVCRASALMRYIQSAAQLQLAENGLSYDNMKARRRAFLLSRIRMEFYDTVRAYQPLYALTFPCESRGYSFLRCYRLLRENTVVAQAVSVWALVDTQDHSLVRVSDFPLALPTGEPLDLSLDPLRMPSALTRVGTYHVGYADTDQNGHMNNTRYPDLYADFCPMRGMRMSSVTIRYMKEAPSGQDLIVERAKEGEDYYFRTRRADGQINAEARVRLEPI